MILNRLTMRYSHFRAIKVRLKKPSIQCQSSRGMQRPSINEYLPPRESYAAHQRKVGISDAIQYGFTLGLVGYAICWARKCVSVFEEPPVEKRSIILKSVKPISTQKSTPTASDHPEEIAPEPKEQEVSDEPKQKEEPKEEVSYEPRRSPSGIPEKVPYLIIGGGTAAFAAYRSIKANDPRAKILIVSKENSLPYMRPPLSKELWYLEKDALSSSELVFKSFSGRKRNLFYEKEPFYTPTDLLEFNDKGGISVIKGKAVTQLDTQNHVAVLDDGRKIQYDKCLIATGGTPNQLQVFGNLDQRRVTTFRSIGDFFILEDLIKNGQVRSIAIVGGGFLGTELASSMATLGKKIELKITQIFPEKGPLAKILPEYLSKWSVKMLASDGIKMCPESQITSAKVNDEGKVELTTDKETVVVDHVVVATGITPNTQLAKAAGLQIDENNGGLVANSRLETSEKNVFVAGDVASYFHPGLGRHHRFEHHDNAIVSGKIAGENMTGGSKEMTTEPMFWSDFGIEVGMEGIGQLDSSLETVAVYTKSTDDEQKDYDRGVVFYKDSNDIVVGVLLWNVFNHMSIARRVVREKRSFDDLTEVAKLFNLYKLPSEEGEASEQTENKPATEEVSSQDIENTEGGATSST